MGQTRNKNKQIREMENNISIPQCRNGFTNVLRFFQSKRYFNQSIQLKIKVNIKLQVTKM
jgi:hypothetical protein